MALIKLEGMQFFARHGCYEEEQIIGSHYVVDVVIGTSISRAATSDELPHTINYETVYQIVEAEMRKPANLLEHLLFRIVYALKYQFARMQGLQVTVRKLHPPMEGQVGQASVEEELSFVSTCGRCRKSFICYDDDTCWCKSVNSVHPKTFENIKVQFGGKCLCPDCLSFFAG
jgi:dihydroneopterin aldolase